MDTGKLTALELGQAIREGRVKVRDAVLECYEKIEKEDPDINAFVYLSKDKALEKADQIQKMIDECGDRDKLSPLAGVPVAIKDNMCIEDEPTTCCSKILDGFKSTFTSTAVLKAEQAGMIVIGKTNMDEFAMGSTTETSCFGPCRNPRNKAHVTGGSSGGSCAAVASGMVKAALGSDTGGSIRQPSAYCGVVGIKPTYGTVSRSGLIAYASSLDQIGPIADNVTDAVAILQAIAGHDEKDATSIDRNCTATGYDFMSALKLDVQGMKIGIPKDYISAGLDKEIADKIHETADILKSRGAIVEEFDLGLVEYAIPAYYIIACAEASSNLERFDGVKYGYRTKDYHELHEMYKKTRSEGFGSEVKRRIMLGSFVLSSGYYDAYYLKALRTKALIKKAFDKAFSEYDAILSPVAPTTAPLLGKSLTDPIKMYLSDVYTVSVNLCSLPSISLPAGISSDGLPIGVQFIGNVFREDNIIRAARALEDAVHLNFVNDKTVLSGSDGSENGKRADGSKKAFNDIEKGGAA
ncbi:MAG: Asp-tRNA(Asn)/Glu-tRNA(Gln) amidotransferase subunit GatA [Lachnospiraceae bacterium]|nr:Asp-tRNA(Asn)/Glu-tRNA(Gln) amidotransferase subunit GatA [Lachnospiraceae bacterium]MEE3461146.1 Asp-tRNA(Asn)/Glu-tRNA(Gln) amidotransferase subunit GatA [Lachnospiraceae bacterium]